MNIKYGAVLFLVSIIILVGIYGSSTNTGSYTQQNITSNNLGYCVGNPQCITPNNPVIGVNQSTLAGSNQIEVTNTSTAHSSTPTQNTNSCSITCQIENGWTALVSTVCNGIGGCTLFGGPANLGKIAAIGLQIQGKNVTQAQIANEAVSIANQQTKAQNNVYVSVFGSPLNAALIAAGIFIGLGVLAGTFGAGILARSMVSAGIALSIIIYVEASLNIFSGLPFLINIVWNGVIAGLLLIILWSTFADGGSV